MGLFSRLFGSSTPDDLEQAFATGEIDAETYKNGLKAKAQAEAEAKAAKQKALQETLSESRSLQGATPSTHAESNGYGEDDHFSSQDLGQSELNDLKEMRESGGIVSQWVHARALLEFGSGAEFESEEDALADYLNDVIGDLDNLLISLGEDAIWYPRSYAETVETRGGDFSHIECIEPWTMDPTTDQHGEITRFTQTIGNEEVGRFEPDDIGYFILNKSSGRDKLGISQVYRAKEEIETFIENKNSVRNAIELAGFPHVHWKVGAEDSMIINDNELRRVRNIVGNMDSDSQIVTGTDVEHSVMEPTTFDFTDILTHDARQVATALGVPVEVATVISEGLGSGEQSDFRRRWFESQAMADRRMLSGQFVEQVAKPLLVRYGGFSEELVSDSDIHIEFGPLFEDDNTSDMLNQIGEDMTVNERRSAYGKEPLDDDEVGESFDTARGETTEDTQPEGGLFGGDGRELQDIEDIDTGDYPDAAVENARMALDAKEETGNPNDCGTQVGWERANQLDNGEDLSEDTINRMAQFERHEDNYDPDAERSDCGWMMWKAWGGDEGIEWAQDKVEEFEQAREASGDSGNWYPADGDAWETAMYQTWEHQLASDDTDRKLFGFSASDTPEFVFDRIRDAINSGVLFSQIDAIDSGARMELQTLLKDSLTDDGWTISELTEEIQEFAGISADRAEVIARTETAGILNTAREKGYEAQGQLEDSKFYWTNPLDDRTTDACEWLTEKTNPFRGGEPVSLEELKELIEEAPTHDDEMSDNMARPDDLVIHPNERSSWVRAPESL